MQPGFDRRTMTHAQTQAGVVDQGLRAFMLRVYNYMASGVALTGIIAALVAKGVFAQNALAVSLVTPPIGWVMMLAPLVFILVLSFGINRLSPAMTQGLFWAFAAVMGISLSTIFLVFTGASIARVFFITAATFGALSLYGYTTKKDLSGWGTFLFMGLVGIVIASIVNIFLQSSMLQFVVSVAGVLVFAGLTAYDTQRIKEMYWEADESGVATKKAVMGALSLYLDFINLFMMLLSLFGQER